MREWLPTAQVWRPHRCHNRQGTQFSSVTWTALCEKLAITHNMTTANHPQGNGMVEHSQRQLKNWLRARLAANDWPSHLPWVLLGLRADPRRLSMFLRQSLYLGLLWPCLESLWMLLSWWHRRSWRRCRCRVSRLLPRGRSPTLRLQPVQLLACNMQSLYMCAEVALGHPWRHYMQALT